MFNMNVFDSIDNISYLILMYHTLSHDLIKYLLLHLPPQF